MNRLTIALLTGCMALVGPELRAETFILAHGGRIEGRWLNSEGELNENYDIELHGGGRITLMADQVQEVIVKSENQLRYEAALPKVPHTLEGHWDMAEKCRKAGLKTQRDYHLRKVIEFDPDHEKARYGLGFSRVDGKWIRAEEWLVKQGYVRYKGAWRLAQEVDLDARLERRTIEEKEWRKRLKVWRSSIVRGRNDSAQALSDLKSINNTLAITALAEMLNDEDEVKQLKVVYIEVLGQFNSPAAAAALLERVMKDPDPNIRERCIEKLKVRGTGQAVAALSKGLKDKSNTVINQSAWALGQLGAPEAIPALINAVTTKHRVQVAGGNPNQMAAGFSNIGGNGFNTGGRAKFAEHEVRNQQVLNALTELTPDGVNFGYDKQRWKNWFAFVQSPPGIDLRRDF